MKKIRSNKQDKKQKSVVEDSLRKINLKSRKVVGGVVIAGLIIGGSLFYITNNPSAAYIVIDGQQIGLVESEVVGENLVRSILQESGQAVNQIAKTKRIIDYQRVRVDDRSLLKESISKDELRDKLDPYVEGYAIQVAGTAVAVLPTSEDVDKVLTDFKNYYAQPSDSKKVTSVEFQESVVTEKIETQPEQIQSLDQVLALLIKGNESLREYTVEANDSLWLIARKNNMLIEDVLNSNSNLTKDTALKPGQKLKLASIAPYINVISKGEYSTTETIPFNVITKTDYYLASGQTQIKQQGNDGSKTVAYSYVQKNDKITEKKVLEEKKIKEPVDKVIVQGPASVSVASSTLSRGAGQNSGFIWPLSGPITSPFGWRKSGFHGAIDIGAPSGTPIVAAASGKVISAGWNGSYGLSILIDNGNGIKTRYSDNSKLLVSAGQVVTKGEKIALVGSTGNSTGPHVDFEVIINGVRVDPLKYLP